MKKARWVSAAAGTALVAATFALPGAGVAYASGNGNVTGNGNLSILSGNTVTAPVSAPVNLCGVSLAVLGFSNSSCQGGSSSNRVRGRRREQPQRQRHGQRQRLDRLGQHGDGADQRAGERLRCLRGGGRLRELALQGRVHLERVRGRRRRQPQRQRHGRRQRLDRLGEHGDGAGQRAGQPVRHLAGAARLRELWLRGRVQLVRVRAGGGGSDNGNVMGVGNVSTGSGNTVTAPVSAPVNVCGISLGLLGFSNSGCEGGSTSCIGDQCAPPCEGSDCNTPPPCERDHCNTPPPCERDHCNAPPPCEGSDCQPPPCQGNHCAPPPCHGDCTPPGPTTPPHGTIPTVPGTTTAVTTATMPSSGLPTTGADLLLLGVAALGSIGVGAGTVALARRRRNGEAS